MVSHPRVFRILLCAVVVGVSADTLAQNAQLWTSPGGVRLTLPAPGFIEGRVRERLLDGRSVKVDLSLAVSTRPDGPALAQASHTCTFSFDLWEERFAVTGSGTPARAISHLLAPDAEAWCVDQLILPLSAFNDGAKRQPFWIRLDLRVVDPAPPAAARRDEGVSIERLIDALSRRREDRAAHRVIEAGPLRLVP